MAPADLGGHEVAVEDRQHDVDEDELRVEDGDLAERMRAVRGHLDLVAEGLEEVDDAGRLVSIVLHDKNPHGSRNAVWRVQKQV